jgi:hypothetical protein
LFLLVELGLFSSAPCPCPFRPVKPYDSQIPFTSLLFEYRVHIHVEEGGIVSDAICFGMPKSFAQFLNKARLTLCCVCLRSVIHTSHDAVSYDPLIYSYYINYHFVML